jgi:hypothetical protein
VHAFVCTSARRAPRTRSFRRPTVSADDTFNSFRMLAMAECVTKIVSE